MDEEYFNMFKDILKNKREAKQLRIIHNEMFDIYISKQGPLEIKTAKAYWKMISQFVLYPPSFDPSYLERFLNIKFNLKKLGGTFKSSLTGTPLKYYNCINRFLKFVYSSEYSKINPQYAASIKEEIKTYDNSVSVSDIFNAYYQLT